MPSLPRLAAAVQLLPALAAVKEQQAPYLSKPVVNLLYAAHELTQSKGSFALGSLEALLLSTNAQQHRSLFLSRLRELVELGLIEKNTSGPRPRYSLTLAGANILVAIDKAMK